MRDWKSPVCLHCTRTYSLPKAVYRWLPTCGLHLGPPALMQPGTGPTATQLRAWPLGSLALAHICACAPTWTLALHLPSRMPSPVLLLRPPQDTASLRAGPCPRLFQSGGHLPKSNFQKEKAEDREKRLPQFPGQLCYLWPSTRHRRAALAPVTSPPQHKINNSSGRQRIKGGKGTES